MAHKWQNKTHQRYKKHGKLTINGDDANLCLYEMMQAIIEEGSVQMGAGYRALTSDHVAKVIKQGLQPEAAYGFLKMIIMDTLDTYSELLLQEANEQKNQA